MSTVMNTATVQPLDMLTLPLSGMRLIEASAGTGKTFTLAALYLRLLLGLGGEAAYPRPLSVEEILVVTFTEAATEELRGRIRSNIHQLRLDCLRGISSDPLLGALLEQITDKNEAAMQLLAAERQMDQSAIHTIHGFCQRILLNHAFESGMLFEQTLIQDETPLQRQACADFWRRHCYPLPLPIARVISQIWSGPEKLLQEIAPYLQGEAPQLSSSAMQQEPDSEKSTLPQAIEQRHHQIIQHIDRVKQHWRQAAPDLGALITQSNVDKRSYSSRYLPVWLASVGEWATQETEEYQLPKDLERFRQSVLQEKTKKGQPPAHSLFIAIDTLCASAASLTLRDLILAHAITEVRQSVQREKRQKAQLGFDDLLSRLDQALHGRDGTALAQAIRQRYPVAMIDEFQDTDPQQYRIFNRLYGQQPECTLLLIGDPKQAIYAFRGADIFTYMRARQEVSAHYTLETNWRSTPAMVNSVNRLFRQTENPFLFAQIPFVEVQAAEKNQALQFVYQEQKQPALQFWLQPEPSNVSEYQQQMARQCAKQIRDWLSAGQQQQAFLLTHQGRRPLHAADITVLVRSRKEAGIIREALNALAIPSVYLSNRDTVFATAEAKDLLWLLQAILAPQQVRTLRTAMATGLLGLDAATLDRLNQDEQAWDTLVAEFDTYRRRWLQRGLLPMLRQLMTQRHLAENLLATPGGERRLTDLLHLGELLQEASTQLDSEPAVVRWLAQQIAQPNPQAANQQLRLESDRHLVQVVTIHKAKGLEYPLVCLPFIGTFRSQKRQKQALYHDRHSYQASLDLHAAEQSLMWAEEERLAEDLRLLYVALTRSIYHCSIGVAPLFQGQRKKEQESDLHHSALGYLLQAGKAGDAGYLQQCLDALTGEGIALSLVDEVDQQPWQPLTEIPLRLDVRHFPPRTYDEWRVTSYSALLSTLQQHSNNSVIPKLLPRLDVEASGEANNKPPATPAPPSQLNAHTFPRGAAAGTFLHNLLEQIDFTQSLPESWPLTELEKQGLDAIWQSSLRFWFSQLLETPLDPSGLCLSALAPEHKQVEWQFYLPIDQLLRNDALDAIIREHDPLSACCPMLDFQKVKGMLKGFIDLVFCWQGRYYLLDYKSNWLGESSHAYTTAAMTQAMIEHRYDLQYQLYTLALHRYLAHRLADYDYQRHFGGVIYLFLRGVDPNQPGQGVYHCRPTHTLVKALDNLLGAKKDAKESAIT